MSLKPYFLGLLLVLYTPIVLGQRAIGAYKFIENKGQWEENVRFKSDLRSGDLYLEDDGLLFNLYDVKTVNQFMEAHHNKSLKRPIGQLKWHAYKISFKNCNKGVISNGYYSDGVAHNYYKGKNRNKWANGANGYEEVVYLNVYDNIDFKMYSRLFDLKYDFIVQPGGNFEEIKLEYKGQDKLSINKGRLHVYTSVNHLIEAEPIVYQIVNGERVLVDAAYRLNGNIISYEISDNYDKRLPLIIDPTLIFSSYSGSFSNNFGYTATFDSDGFLYSGSSAFGGNYPTTLGAYSTNFSGGIVDMAISKWDTTGTNLIYSTLIGGSSDELPHSLIVNSFDELFIFGTSSSPNYPTTSGCYDSTYNGGNAVNMQNGLGVNYVNGSDIVVSRLSANGGILQASTFIGGSANDGLNNTNVNPTLNILRYNYADEVRGEIDIDANNNIYIATCTQSNDFPTTTGAFQENYGGGALDGCVFKLDNNLQNMIWSSYLGAEKHDAVYALAIDDSLDIYVTGGTESDSLFTTNSAVDTSYQGGRADGFVTHIDQSGSQIINSTYIGSSEYDQSYFVELDRPGDIYLLGQTEITDSTFIKNVTWSNYGSGQFVTKLSPELDTVLYSTVFGAGNGINISPTAFLVDLCSKMYLAGWGGSVNNLTSLSNNAGFTNGMPITADALQSTTDGSDFYVMVLEDDASGVVYGSYFGGPQAAEHVDGGTSRFDRKGKVYQAMCAGCGGFSDMPIVPANAYSDTNRNSCNLGVFKMDFNLPVVVADFEAPTIGCAPYSAQFTNTSLSQQYTSFQWDFGDNSTSTLENPTHVYTSPGTYEITLTIQDTATCNFGDTLSKEIIILGDTTYNISDIEICPGDITQIGIAPQNDTSFSYLWTPNIALSDDTISNPFANPSNSQAYQLLVSNGVCTDTVLQNVIVNEPLLTVSNDTILCDDDQIITLNANSFGTSNEYIWSTSNQFTDTINSNINTSSLTIAPEQSNFYFVQINNNGCLLYDSIWVEIASSSFEISTTQFLCEGGAISVGVNYSGSQTYSFDWSADSIIVSGDLTDTVVVAPLISQYVYVNGISNIGCTYSDSILIVVDNLPSINTSISASADTIFQGGSVSLNVLPNGYNYSWSPSSVLDNPNAQSPNATLESTTTFTVTVEGVIDTCAKQENITVFVKEVICGTPDIFIPNAFTPNGDGNNDVLYVRGNNMKEILFRVYNRWGELVFETRDQNIGWDGIYKGKPADPAVFDYYLEGICIDEEPFLIKGNISLIR